MQVIDAFLSPANINLSKYVNIPLRTQYYFPFNTRFQQKPRLWCDFLCEYWSLIIQDNMLIYHVQDASDVIVDCSFIEKRKHLRNLGCQERKSQRIRAALNDNSRRLIVYSRYLNRSYIDASISPPPRLPTAILMRATKSLAETFYICRREPLLCVAYGRMC